MTKREIFRNKNLMGFLTLAELRQISRLEELSLGQHWVPICKVRARGDHIMIWTNDDYCEPDVGVPAGQIVMVSGNIAKMNMDTRNILTTNNLPERVEARIRLDRVPFRNLRVSES